MTEQPVKNTDRELYREPKGDLPSDYYAPSVHVTEHGAIAMNVGGHVITTSIRGWHALATNQPRGSVMHDLRTEIQVALNKHSAENGSNTPDFILADYLESCLSAFDRATQARDEWHKPAEHVISDNEGCWCEPTVIKVEGKKGAEEG